MNKTEKIPFGKLADRSGQSILLEEPPVIHDLTHPAPPSLAEIFEDLRADITPWKAFGFIVALIFSSVVVYLFFVIGLGA